MLPTAALFMRTSRRPNSSLTLAAAASIDFRSVTSSWIVERVPLIPVASISDCAAWAFSTERLAMITWNVFDALTSTFDVAKPIPEFAPVECVST